MWEFMMAFNRLVNKHLNSGTDTQSTCNSVLCQYDIFGDLFEKWYHVYWWED